MLAVTCLLNILLSIVHTSLCESSAYSLIACPTSKARRQTTDELMLHKRMAAWQKVRRVGLSGHVSHGGRRPDAAHTVM
jgi:hypothetical protein